MAKKTPVVWDAPRHTIAKIEILKNYLNAWFPIVGSTFRELLYIDGFAGPGIYSNYPEGSPLAALGVIRSRISKEPERISISKVTTIFIEASASRYEELNKNLRAMRLPARVIPRPIRGEFASVMDQLFRDQEYAHAFAGKQPLLVFADPFGGTGVPFRIIEKCLGSQVSELLLNFDADGITRIHSGRNPKWKEQLDDIFGCRDWESHLGGEARNLVRQSQKAVALYKERLLAVPGIRFVWTFEMRDKDDRLNYYLIFATRNRLGMEKMKEAMRSIDQTGNYCFSDAHVGQRVLFRADDVEYFAMEMHKRFRGAVVDYEQVDNYALCETPFVNPKGMLKWLSRSERVEVQARKGETVKAHSFPKERIEAISFVDPPTKSVQLSLL